MEIEEKALKVDEKEIVVDFLPIYIHTACILHIHVYMRTRVYAYRHPFLPIYIHTACILYIHVYMHTRMLYSMHAYMYQDILGRRRQSYISFECC